MVPQGILLPGAQTHKGIVAVGRQVEHVGTDTSTLLSQRTEEGRVVLATGRFGCKVVLDCDGILGGHLVALQRRTQGDVGHLHFVGFIHVVGPLAESFCSLNAQVGEGSVFGLWISTSRKGKDSLCEFPRW